MTDGQRQFEAEGALNQLLEWALRHVAMGYGWEQPHGAEGIGENAPTFEQIATACSYMLNTKPASVRLRHALRSAQSSMTSADYDLREVAEALAAE